MQYRTLHNPPFLVSPLGIGTWVMGGWMWGGTSDRDSQEALLCAFDHGVNLIDTAPIYGFGRAEEIIGATLKQYGKRDAVLIATKFGLEWDEKHRIRKNCSRARILAEIDQSLRRLNTDYIDIYQVHWPDDNTSLIETMSTLSRLQKEGKIRSFGVCNYSVNRIEKIIKHYHLQSIQMPFNLLEQQNKHTLFPFCTKNNLSVLAYGTLCKGLLTGKFTHRSVFNKTDSRYSDPAFKGEQFDRNLKIVEILSSFAAQKKCSLAQLCIEWTISQPELTCALIGTRNRKQAEENFSALDNPLFSSDDFSLFERSIAHLIL